MTTTTDPHGWPDPARPGCPANPERDGWHWVGDANDPVALFWKSVPYLLDGGVWFSGTRGASVWRYLGPCLTPAEVAAAVQAEREAIAKWHDERKAYCDQRAQEKIKDGDSSAADTPIIVGLAHEHSATVIRSRGPTPALDAALAQARREGMEAAAALIEDADPALADFICLSASAGERAEAAKAGRHAHRRAGAGP